MGLPTITLFDIAVFGAVSLAIVIAGFIALVVLGWRYHTLTQNDFKESLRLTRALGSLIVQEAGKIRAAIGR